MFSRLRQLFENLLSRDIKPTEPARSMADISRLKEQEAAKSAYDLEVEKNASRRSGF